ncbi:branched-chain amino acid ABC transporter permease [Dactylosporangium sp. NPDC051485]|uniref:branched-chain amino acid ABC transporter permease n=1 Tax=Dactylosporangium sp. NPDC051485 TaxID=3154846 RepID=UPI00343DFAE9
MPEMTRRLPRSAWSGRARCLPAAPAVVALVAGLTVLPWLVNGYVITVATTVLIFGLLALSTQWLAATAGLHTIGQGAYLGVGAYTAAIVAEHVTASGPVQTVAAAGAAATAGGLVGAVAYRARGVTYLMITLAVGELAGVIAVQARPVTGGSDGLHVPPVLPLPGLGPLLRDGWAYLYVLAWTVAITGGMVVAHRSRFGLILRGVAGHEPRMRANGHPVPRHLIAAQALAAAVAGAAGALAAAAHHYLSPADLAFDVSALALVAAIVGGRSITLTLLTAAALIVVRDWAAPVTGAHAPLLLGMVFLLVAYAPLRHTPCRWWRRVGPWPRRDATRPQLGAARTDMRSSTAAPRTDMEPAQDQVQEPAR